MKQMNKRAARFVAGTVVVALSVVGASPVKALDDAPIAVTAAPRQYCTGHDTFSVHRLYRAYFLREPDAGGLAYWQDILATGRLNLGGIAQMFAQSPEFTNRYGNLSNRAFVELVYRNVLGREGDPGGLAWWTGLLDRGYWRGEIMVGFSDSAEFKERTGLVFAVPTATDPQVIPDTDPFTVHPGGRLEFHGDDENRRSYVYWFSPFPVPAADIFEWSGRELLCLGWTIRRNDLDNYHPGEEGRVVVSSENNLVAIAFIRPVEVVPPHPAHPYGWVIRLDLEIRRYDPGLDPWQPVTP